MTTLQTDSIAPAISVVILNYNGAKWMERCLASLKSQTIFSHLEIIVADNKSSDGSDALAERLLTDWPNAQFIQNGENLGFCEGNNRGAKPARGRFLFFLNNDTWLEPDCLEILLNETARRNASVSTPLVMNYGDDSFQSLGASGFDTFGLTSSRRPHSDARPVFMPEGCSYLIERELFWKLGGFDAELFMFADEFDLSWRTWISGHDAFAIPAARLHHRGAANVNPKGESAVVEFRTSDTKRYYANRNNLLVLLKNAQHLLLLIVPLQLGLLAFEALVGLILIRRWSFIKRAYLDSVLDCWCLRKHILAERKRVKAFRKRGDFWMLRFLRFRLNRWDEFQRLRQFGVPKITQG